MKNEKDEEVNVQNLVSDSGLVLFLVPKADTRVYTFYPSLKLKLNLKLFLIVIAGCTQQACGFRDIYPDFQAVNYKVYCLSADSPTAQTKWQTKGRFHELVEAPNSSNVLTGVEEISPVPITF